MEGSNTYRKHKHIHSYRAWRFSRFELKADKSTTYTKTEVDNNLALKANQSTTYTKTEVDNNLALKANQSTTCTKTEVDNRSVLKANQATNYLALKQNKSSFASDEGDTG